MSNVVQKHINLFLPINIAWGKAMIISTTPTLSTSIVDCQYMKFSYGYIRSYAMPSTSPLSIKLQKRTMPK